MTAQHTSLDGLRREIDQIDDQIHDLIMHRVEVVRRIGSLKGDDGISLRPAREAMILRRLAARHDGSLPLPVLLRMWRELLSGTTRVQGPFAVAVYAPEDRRGFWDIARDHFGSFTPMTAVNTPVAAVRAVSEGSATVGIVPWPEEEERDPWWRYLLGEDQTTPRIVARLPFCGRGNTRSEDWDCLAVARMPAEASGDDRTLLGVEVMGDMSRGRLKDALDKSGLKPLGFRSWLGKTQGASSLHLVEMADYVDRADPRLASFLSNSSDTVQRATPVGGYAVPLGQNGRLD